VTGSEENQPHSVHFEITTRCDSCEQTYHGKATVGEYSLGFGASEKAQRKLDQKVKQVLSEYKGVGVQRCSHCGHIQAWNIEEAADVYARWWTLGIAVLIFSAFFVFTYATAGFDLGSPDIWLNLLKLVGFPLITYYVGILILRPVLRGYHLVKYRSSENFKPEIRVVNEY
jgi:hypothetical protein